MEGALHHPTSRDVQVGSRPEDSWAASDVWAPRATFNASQTAVRGVRYGRSLASRARGRPNRRAARHPVIEPPREIRSLASTISLDADLGAEPLGVVTSLRELTQIWRW